MKKYFLILAVLFTVTAHSACAQRSTTSDYNYLKAVEAYYDEDDDDKALKLVTDQIDDTPDHIDSRFLRAKIYWRADKYDAALRDVRHAIKRYNGKPSVFKSTLYGLMGNIYSDMESYDEAIEAYRQAAKLAKKDNPTRVQSFKFDCAQALYFAKRLDDAEKMYLEMLHDDPGDCAAMIGLSRNCLDLGKYEEGLGWTDKAETYDASYPQVYRFKMQLLAKLNRNDECVDAALKYFDLDDNVPAKSVVEYADKHYSYAVAKLKAEMNKEGGNNRWIVLLTELYEYHGDYQKAIELYDKVENEYGAHLMIDFYKSQCYFEMGDFNSAIKEINKAIEKSGDNRFVGHRGDIHRGAGMYQQAIDDYKLNLEEDPSEGYSYYAIGWCYSLLGDDTTAMEYYNQGIDIDKTYPYLFQNRADLFKKLGRNEDAVADYERVLELDNDPAGSLCRHFALLGLGRNDEALEWMEKIIEVEPNDHGNYYDKACLLARMGRSDDALKALRTAFEMGFRKFAHMEHDSDMDSVRDLPEYKALIEEFKQTPVSEVDNEAVIDAEVGQAMISEVQMKKMSGGTYEVPCTINGLPLKFIFDTGASDVTISSVEANFMLKNDYLALKDFRGKKNYLTASGEISEGAVICIKEVIVGDVVLKNIEASVVKNQKAPLLLGQSVLERFGSITIDNTNAKLIITKY